MADMGVLLQLVWNQEWPEFISTMGGLSFCALTLSNGPLRIFKGPLKGLEGFSACHRPSCASKVPSKGLKGT